MPPYGRPAPEAPPPPPAPPAAGGQPLPAEAPPQASGSGDRRRTIQNGMFVDPAGGTGVFAAGADKLAPAENWVDLMMDPRQA